MGRFLRIPSSLREYPVIDLRDPRQRRRVVFFLVAGALELILFSIGGFRVEEYMNTSDFCGRFCHQVMKPQFTVYQQSPHARVACVTCHIGPGAEWQVRMKLSGIRQVVATALNTYPRPIPSPVVHLRPARETCENCHWPQKFSEDRLRLYRRFAEDEKNSPQLSAQAFRVGGGGVPASIHWHVTARVWYLPLDDKRQEIGWVGVERPGGVLEEYLAPKLTRDSLAERVERDKRLMDCIDCHNRATHIFRPPEELIDAALARGDLDPGLPYIKKKSLEVLTASGPKEAQELVAALPQFYRASLSDMAADKAIVFAQAQATLQELIQLTYFQEMKVDWKTYPNNIGHTRSPGCFRCHGQVANVENAKPLEAGCNLCHYPIPPEVLRVTTP